MHIRPRVVQTGSEMQTEEMAQAIHAAWGVTPFNNFGTTEGLFGTDNADHCGIILFEDLAIVEVVDERNQPVDPGTVGARMLITNIFNYTQPLIRYEVSDRVALATEPCPSAGPFQRLGQIEGRSEDILYLEGSGGQIVPVHPIHFRSALAALPEVKQYQIVQDGKGIHVFLALRAGASPQDVVDRARAGIDEKLRRQGVRPPSLDIVIVENIQRDPQQMGKLKIVRSTLKPPQPPGQQP